MPKLTIFIFFLEIFNGLNISLVSLNVIQNLLLLSSLVSLIVGTVVGLNQVKIKRLLTFSTISHVGFLLLVLSLNTESAVQAFIFYLFQYSISNLDIFFILLAFGYLYYNNSNIRNKLILSHSDTLTNNVLNLNKTFITDIHFIDDLKGFLFKFPLLSLSFSICLFSMAGTPPLIGFFAKQQLLFSSLYSGFYFISFVAIIVSVVSASYYLKLVKIVSFTTEAEVQNVNDKFHFTHYNANVDYNVKNNKILVFNPDLLFINNNQTFIISLLTLFILLFIFKSSFILNSTYVLAKSTFFL
jgi:NADH-ubiquinone oxidoreductase chain 2